MYQPPWQDAGTLEDAAKRCYGWVIPRLASQKDFKVTINSNYSLSELFLKHGLGKIVDALGEGLQNEAFEITATAAYHPLLPLLPEDEIRRQIDINDSKHREIFKGLWKPKGFFPPELAFSNDVGRIVKEMGYQWIITEDIVYNIERKIPSTSVATLDGLPVFFRSSEYSNRFSFPIDENGKPLNTINAKQFVHWLNERIRDDSYAILAMDMETIGLHHYYTQETLEYLVHTLKEVGLDSVHMSSLLEKYPGRLEMDASRQYRGSWSTMEKDLENSVPYRYWKDPSNKIHSIQWQLVDYAINAVGSARGSEGYDNARRLLDRGLQSCQFWWATPENIKRDDYKPGNILKGATLLLGSVLSLKNLQLGLKKEAKVLYRNLYEAVQGARPR
jgi:predicted glycosyl hydrolase (DUF1957 family)